MVLLPCTLFKYSAFKTQFLESGFQFEFLQGFSVSLVLAFTLWHWLEHYKLEKKFGFTIAELHFKKGYFDLSLGIFLFLMVLRMLKYPFLMENKVFGFLYHYVLLASLCFLVTNSKNFKLIKIDKKQVVFSIISLIFVLYHSPFFTDDFLNAIYLINCVMFGFSGIVYTNYVKTTGNSHAKIAKKVLIAWLLAHTITECYLIFQPSLILVSLAPVQAVVILTLFKRSIYNPNLNKKIDGFKTKTEVLLGCKYQKSGLSPDVSKILSLKVLTIIKEEKLYLKNDLDLSMLAAKVNVNRYHLSQIINTQFSNSFYNLINELRVKEAIYLLENDKNVKICDVIFMCGFNNKVSFYKAFKKITNCSPKEYLAKAS